MPRKNNIPKWELSDTQQQPHNVEFTTTADYRPVHNRGGVYHLFRKYERHKMDPTAYASARNRTNTEPTNPPLHGQRSCHQINENPNLSPKVTAYRPQIPLYPRDGGQGIGNSSRDSREGEPGRYINEVGTNDSTTQMDEWEWLNGAINEFEAMWELGMGVGVA